MTTETAAPPPEITAALTFLAGLEPVTQIILAATVIMMTIMLIVWREYRRRTRTTPTLRARAATLTAHGLRAAWTALRTPPTADQKTKRANATENLLVFGFVFVVAGLIMQGLVPFARDDMGLTGIWPYLLFFALDGMAAYFGLISYRLAKEGAKAASPRLMVLAIMGGSAWFQWEHASGRDLPAQVAWTALPLIAGYLWETTLKYRRRAWKKAHTDTGRQVPKARWMWDPIGSLGITRRTHMWNLTTWEEGLETHMTRAECVRQLRREFGPFWSWKVPADVAIQLKRGFKVEEAAAKVPQVIATHRKESENRRIVKEAQQRARAGAVEPGTYTVSVPDSPVVDLTPVAGVADVVEPLEAAPAVVEPTPWADPAAAWDPQDDEYEPFPEPAPYTPHETPADPWANAPTHADEFTPLDTPTGTGTGSTVEPLTDDEAGFWDTLTGAGEDVTPDQKTTPAPTDVVGYLPAPYSGPRWDKAVRVYKASVEAGKPLSNRGLCKAMGVSPNNRRWGMKVIDAGHTEEPTLFSS